MQPEQALTVREAAHFLQVSTTTIYAHARAGRIPAHRVGAALRFFASELMRETTFDPWARSPQSVASRSRRRSTSTGAIRNGARLK
ncbi:MAG: helix-turn-helix domain-containing protein [Kineosporiaceae bacterium]|nr:helix-turn-helix domain-containing protein [Aeromicrobium sp.]